MTYVSKSYYACTRNYGGNYRKNLARTLLHPMLGNSLRHRSIDRAVGQRTKSVAQHVVLFREKIPRPKRMTLQHIESRTPNECSIHSMLLGSIVH